MNKKLIVIVGPTAAGKTKASIELAEKFNGEIVSADSRLLYRGMDIGTAKPTMEELSLIRHHLVNVSEPDVTWSLAKYQKAAFEAIDDIHSRGKLPFLVGGTGQYIKSIYQGWNIPEVKPDLNIRSALENWSIEIGDQGLYDRLVVIDPTAAKSIQPQNLRRTIRALEVIFISGRKFSMQRKRTEPLYQSLILGISISRQVLYERIDTRLSEMIKSGFVEEVKFLLTQGYSSDQTAFSAIGYRQIMAYLNGEITLVDALVEIKRLTRQLVRRQANWFKPNDTEISWFQADSTVISSMESKIKEFLLK
jgi:tRNA dimethylallyltransferase